MLNLVLGSQPAGDVSHKPGGRLSLLSARPAVTPATVERAATILLLGEQRHNGCEQFAYDCYPTASWLRSEPRPFCAWVQHANHSATVDRSRQNLQKLVATATSIERPTIYIYKFNNHISTSDVEIFGLTLREIVKNMKQSATSAAVCAAPAG